MPKITGAKAHAARLKRFTGEDMSAKSEQHRDHAEGPARRRSVEQRALCCRAGIRRLKNGRAPLHCPATTKNRKAVTELVRQAVERAVRKRS